MLYKLSNRPNIHLEFSINETILNVNVFCDCPQCLSENDGEMSDLNNIQLNINKTSNNTFYLTGILFGNHCSIGSDNEGEYNLNLNQCIEKFVDFSNHNKWW